MLVLLHPDCCPDLKWSDFYMFYPWNMAWEDIVMQMTLCWWTSCTSRWRGVKAIYESMLFKDGGRRLTAIETVLKNNCLHQGCCEALWNFLMFDLVSEWSKKQQEFFRLTLEQNWRAACEHTNQQILDDIKFIISIWWWCLLRCECEKGLWVLCFMWLQFIMFVRQVLE